jgi:hypothetical protein
MVELDATHPELRSHASHGNEMEGNYMQEDERLLPKQIAWREKKKERLNRLSCFAEKLRSGHRCHVTGLAPICHLVTSDYAISDDPVQQYFMFLITTSRRLLMEGSSLSTVHVVDEEIKLKLLDSGITLLTEYYRNYDGILRVGKELIDLYNEISGISPGVKRIAVHASRRKLEDADLLLMESIIWFSLNHDYAAGSAYYASQIFISDRARMRFNLDSRSAARVEEIIKFLLEKFSIY